MKSICKRVWRDIKDCIDEDMVKATGYVIGTVIVALLVAFLILSVMFPIPKP